MVESRDKNTQGVPKQPSQSPPYFKMRSLSPVPKTWLEDFDYHYALWKKV